MKKALYVAYISGPNGNSMGLYCIGDGIIAGADLGGMKYDGIYQIAFDESYEGIIAYLLPSNIPLVTGQIQQVELPIEMPIKFPPKFWDGQIIRLETPVGPVNVRFEKIRDLD